MMRRLAALLACALPLAACGPDARAQDEPAGNVAGPPPARNDGDAPGAGLVAGYWRGEREPVELFRNGTALLYRWPGRVIGRWQFVEADRMLIEFPFTGAIPGDFRVTREADRLRLCETDRPARCMVLTVGERAESADSTETGPPGLVRQPSTEPPDRRTLADDGAPRLAPLPSSTPPEARAAEAGPLLKQASTLQHAYQQRHDRFAATWEELASVGWSPTPLRYFHPPVIRAATADRFCIEMQPRDRDLWTVSVTHGGSLERGSCASRR